MSEPGEVLVIGAGAAGLAAAAMLERRDIPATVLERTDQVASSWRGRYDSLILNTPRITSTLAGYRLPRRYGRWPTRDDVIEYLEEYARRQNVKIRFGVEVQRLERRNGGWSVETSEGELAARQVVIATGHEKEPLIPDLLGRSDFPGQLIHSADYRNAEPFQGQDVLVIGEQQRLGDRLRACLQRRGNGVDIDANSATGSFPVSGSGCRSTTQHVCWTCCPTVPSIESPDSPSG